MTNFTFPMLTLAAWRSTRDALHAYARALGHVRRALTPPQKHWWHIALSASGRGLTTTPMPGGPGAIELTLNVINSRVEIVASDGFEQVLPFAGQSAHELGTGIARALRSLDVELPDVGNALDVVTYAYDSLAASRYWTALAAVDLVFKEFKGRLREETGPVHVFPHHFDLSLNWFSGRRVPGVDPADTENADEQMNFGFVTGDAGIDDAYFYATAYPLPDDLTSAALPESAYWHTTGFTGAVLPYATIAECDGACTRLLDFLVAAQQAGAERMC